MKFRIGLGIGVLAIIGTVFYFMNNYVAHVPGPLPQQALITQPAWSKELYQAVEDHGSAFDELVVTVGDITDSDHGPGYVLNPIDYSWLAQRGRRVGLLMQFDPMSPKADATAALASCVRTIQERSSAGGLHPVEIMFDCRLPRERIADVTQWIAPLRGGPIPISVAVGPDWLRPAGFSNLAKLAKTAGSFVLHEDTSGTQVQANVIHEDTDLAARIGVPFRVMLRSYVQPWQAQSSVDPAQMAQIERQWTAQHPTLLRAVLWNNFSFDDDPESWRWITLDSVMAGTNPTANLQVVVRHLEADVNEIDVLNKGTGDGNFTSKISVTWPDADLADAKPLPDFDRADTGRRSMVFTPQGSLATKPIRAGEQRGIGWLRLTDDSPVQATIIP